jgi:LuxR family transcriptional regulator, quorum-sensing system regulator BjaR1
MDFDIADAISAISAAPDPKTCSRLFLKAIAAFKINMFACGEVDLAAPERTVFFAVNWPEAFRNFYFETGLMRRDPILAALRHRHAPFTWSDLRRDGKLSMAGSKAFQIAAEHGWTEGLAVPIPRGDQRFGLVTVAGPRHTLEPGERSRLAMLSYCFHQRMRNLVPKHGFAFSPVGLTRREIDALRLIARGATDRGVARKLGISPSTAHEHLENAKRKLNVSTRAEAIAVAVSLAIVAP